MKNVDGDPLAVAAFEVDIRAFMNEHGGEPEDWCVGISTEFEEAYSRHHLQKGDICKTWDTGSEAIAREVERAFVKGKNKTDGDTGGGKTPTIVYAYLKNDHTDP